jgi:hypothetical protein
MAARLIELAGTRAGGFVLTRQEARPENGKGDLRRGPHCEGGTGHRGTGIIASIGIGPMPPTVPMLSPLAKTTPSLVR